MSKCIKDYRRHGMTYLAGSDYDVDKTLVEADEAYMGEKLWEGAKKVEKKEESTEETAEETPKKTTKKSKK